MTHLSREKFRATNPELFSNRPSVTYTADQLKKMFRKLTKERLRFSGITPVNLGAKERIYGPDVIQKLEAMGYQRRTPEY